MNDDDQMILARQLRCPIGAEGVAVGERMNAINATMNQVALDHLDSGSSDHVLEIGFGFGSLLEQLLSRSSFVTGLDLSPTMVKAAMQRFGFRVKACCGNALALPFEDPLFTKICTVNTVYFWEDLHKVFSGCRRVLRPGGALVVCFNAHYELKKGAWDRYKFTLYTDDEVISSLLSAGFAYVDRRLEQDSEQGEFFCLRAS